MAHTTFWEFYSDKKVLNEGDGVQISPRRAVNKKLEAKNA